MLPDAWRCKWWGKGNSTEEENRIVSGKAGIGSRISPLCIALLADRVGTCILRDYSATPQYVFGYAESAEWISQ